MTLDPVLALESLNASTQALGLNELPVWSDIPVDAIVPGVTCLVDQVRKAFHALEENQQLSWDSVMVPLEQLGHQLSRPMARIGIYSRSILIRTARPPMMKCDLWLWRCRQR